MLTNFWNYTNKKISNKVIKPQFWREAGGNHDGFVLSKTPSPPGMLLKLKVVFFEKDKWPQAKTL